MVLAWAAQSGRFPGFNAASQAGYLDIAGIDCQPGQKKARVSYFPDRTIVDYLQLFTATSMMPSHVIADELGIDVTQALQAGDPAAVQRIADAWNTTWDLKPGIDLKKFPAAGPYKIDAVLPQGAVVLVANDRWWGAAPVTKRVTVWPRGVDVQDRINNGSFHVIDVATGSSGTLTTPDTYQSRQLPSGGIEQLIFAPQARWRCRWPAGRSPSARPRPDRRQRGDADRQCAAQPGQRRRVQPDRGLAEAGQFSAANPDAARATLNGAPLTVRIGYQSPNPRLAATVGAIARSCAAAGITVVDATSDTTGPQTLRDGQLDVLLASTGGATGSGSTGSSAMDGYALRTGNGNNLPGYSNPQIDGIIAALAVTIDPKGADPTARRRVADPVGTCRRCRCTVSSAR